jgi:hypothetical protein
MASCSRCDIERLILERGLKNVIEIIRPHWNGWDQTGYEIYVAGEGDHSVVHNGRSFHWAMTCFSEQHSQDEDCWQPLMRGRRKTGFPKVRLEPGMLEAING